MSEPFWVPLGGAGAVDYKGEWAAGTQYAPGDVVRYGGVDYLAVNPSLGSIPPLSFIGGPEIAYGELTSDLTLPTGGVDIITLAPVAFDGATKVYIETAGVFTCPGGSGLGVDLYDGAVNLGKIIAGYDFGGYATLRGSRRLTPSAGSHTYKVRGYGITTSVQMYIATGGNVPAFLRVVRA